MRFSDRQYASEQDLWNMFHLALAYPQSTLHRIDLPYRFSSPAMFTEPEHDIRLWDDEEGNLIAWAVWQQPFITLDYAYNPEWRPAGIEEAIIEWGVRRFAEIAAERGERLSYWVGAREGDQERIDLLERHGFQTEGWYMIHMTRPLSEPIAEASLPEGFSIRPIAGEDEAKAYVEVHQAAFRSENMRWDWRMTTMRAPGYTPDLDLVIESPDGRLAAVTICWLSMDGKEGQVEPLAVHPDFQRKGLGRVLMLEGLRRMQQRGVHTAHLEVDCDNPAAISLYESAGFRAEYRILFYGREF